MGGGVEGVLVIGSFTCRSIASRVCSPSTEAARVGRSEVLLVTAVSNDAAEAVKSELSPMLGVLASAFAFEYSSSGRHVADCLVGIESSGSCTLTIRSGEGNCF